MIAILEREWRREFSPLRHVRKLLTLLFLEFDPAATLKCRILKPLSLVGPTLAAGYAPGIAGSMSKLSDLTGEG